MTLAFGPLLKHLRKQSGMTQPGSRWRWRRRLLVLLTENADVATDLTRRVLHYAAAVA
jgi:hypothetical protein